MSALAAVHDDEFKAARPQTPTIRSSLGRRPASTLAAHDAFRENEHGDAVYCVAALDGARFLTVGARDVIKLWDAAVTAADPRVRRREPAKVFGLDDHRHRPDDSVSSIARVDDSHFLTGGRDASHYGSVVRLWSVNGRTEGDGQSSIATFDVWHRGTVTAVACVSSDYFACGIGYNGKYGGMVLVYGIAGGECTHALEHPEEVGPIAAVGDGERLLTGDATGFVRLWNVITGECLRQYEWRGTEVLSLAAADGGERFVSVSHDHAFRVWDIESGRCTLQVDAAHSDFIYSVAWVDDTTIATASRDKTVRLWRLNLSENNSTAECTDVHTHSAPVLAMTSLDGGIGARRRLVSCDAHGDLRLLSFPPNWDVLKPFVLVRELLRQGRAVPRTQACPWLLACIGGRRAEAVLRALVAPTGAPDGLPNELFERTLSFLAPRPTEYNQRAQHTGGG